jgi:hypothetical protein
MKVEEAIEVQFCVYHCLYHCMYHHILLDIYHCIYQVYTVICIMQYTMTYIVIYTCVYIMLHIVIHIILQLGLLSPMNVDAASMFSASEHIVQEHVKKHKNGAEELKDLIQEVLHHPDFNPHDIDHDMHQQVMDCIAQGNLELIDLWEEGDGAQEVMLYKLLALKVLRELIGDERLAGC